MSTRVALLEDHEPADVRFGECGLCWLPVEGHDEALVEEREALAASAFHMGPGPHPSGTTQAVPGVEGAGQTSSATVRGGEATYQPVLRNTPTSGFPVATYPERVKVLPAAAFVAKVYNEYAAAQEDFLRENPARHIGTWIDRSSDLVRLDVAPVVADEVEARRIAVEHQIAVFSLETMDDVRIEEVRAMTYPPQGEGAFTLGRPTEGEDAGEKVAAWVKQQRAEWDEEEAQEDQE